MAANAKRIIRDSIEPDDDMKYLSLLDKISNGETLTKDEAKFLKDMSLARKQEAVLQANGGVGMNLTDTDKPYVPGNPKQVEAHPLDEKTGPSIAEKLAANDEKAEEELKKTAVQKHMGITPVQLTDEQKKELYDLAEKKRDEIKQKSHDNRALRHNSPITTGMAQGGLNAKQAKDRGDNVVEYKTVENLLGGNRDFAERMKNLVQSAKNSGKSFDELFLDNNMQETLNIKNFVNKQLNLSGDKAKERTKDIIDALRNVYEHPATSKEYTEDEMRQMKEKAAITRATNLEKKLAEDFVDYKSRPDNPEATGNAAASKYRLNKKENATEYDRTLSSNDPRKQELAQKLKNAVQNPRALEDLISIGGIDKILDKFKSGDFSKDYWLRLFKNNPEMSFRFDPSVGYDPESLRFVTEHLNQPGGSEDPTEKAYTLNGADIDNLLSAYAENKGLQSNKRKAMQALYDKMKPESAEGRKNFDPMNIRLGPDFNFVSGSGVANQSGKEAEVIARIKDMFDTGSRVHKDYDWDPATGLFTKHELPSGKQHASGYSKGMDYIEHLAKALSGSMYNKDELNDLLTGNAKEGNYFDTVLNSIRNNSGDDQAVSAKQLIKDLADFNQFMTGKKFDDAGKFFFNGVMSPRLLRSLKNSFNTLRGVSGDTEEDALLSLLGKKPEAEEAPAKEKPSKISDYEMSQLKKQIAEEKAKENPDQNTIDQLTAQLNANAATNATLAGKENEATKNKPVESTDKDIAPLASLLQNYDKYDALAGLFGYKIPAEMDSKWYKPFITGSAKVADYDKKRAADRKALVDPKDLQKWLKPNIDNVRKAIKEGNLGSIGEGIDKAGAESIAQSLEDLLALTYGNKSRDAAVQREISGQHTSESLADLDTIAKLRPEEYDALVTERDTVKSDLYKAIEANGGKADTPEIKEMRDYLNDLNSEISTMEYEKAAIRELADSDYAGDYHKAELDYLNPKFESDDDLLNMLVEDNARYDLNSRLRDLSHQDVNKWKSAAGVLKKLKDTYGTPFAGIDDQIAKLDNYVEPLTSTEILKSQDNSYKLLGLTPEEWSALRNVDVTDTVAPYRAKIRKGKATTSNGDGSARGKMKREVAKDLQMADYTDTTEQYNADLDKRLAEKGIKSDKLDKAKAEHDETLNRLRDALSGLF